VKLERNSDGVIIVVARAELLVRIKLDGWEQAIIYPQDIRELQA
jgi:hypothetical protein